MRAAAATKPKSTKAERASRMGLQQEPSTSSSAVASAPGKRASRVSSYVLEPEYALSSFDFRDADAVPESYAKLMANNDYRESLLDDARRYSPISSVFHLRKLPQTAIFRLFTYPIVWILVSVYLSLAIMVRHSIIDLGDSEDEASSFDGAEVLVVFVVVFFLQHCYTRHFEIYNLASEARSTIVNVCASARACLPEQARRKLFVHLNLMHCSFYCALSPIYNFKNFMRTFCELHRIELPDNDNLFGDVDRAGGVHYSQCAVWAMEILHQAVRAGECQPEAFRTMQEQILCIRSKFNAIFAYQYQVIPFAYSHLVSAASFFYLLGLAVIKAVRFRPDAPIVGGFVLPCLSFWIALITTIGLIDIGQAISDPWGNDPEDFAVPRFLHATAKLTRHLVHEMDDDPLEDMGSVNLGKVNLDHLPMEGQSRVPRGHVPWKDDPVSTDVSEGSELPEEDDGSHSPIGTHPIQPWRLGMSIRDSGAAAPLRASEAFAV